MDISTLVWKLVLLFLPGIVATFIIDALVRIPQKAQFRYGIYALLNGLGVYVLLDACTWLFTCSSQFPSLTIWPLLSDPTHTSIEGSEILWSVAIAIPYGFGISALSRKNFLHALAKVCRVSDKYGDNTLWEHLLNSPNTYWVTIRDTSRDLMYQGRVYKYSDGTTEHEICLEDVRVYRNSDSELLYEMDYLYVTGNKDSWLIEFYPKKGD